MEETSNHFTPDSYAASEMEKQRSFSRKARLRRIGSIFFGFGFVVSVIGIILFGDKSNPNPNPEHIEEQMFFLLTGFIPMTIGLLLNSPE